MLDYQKTGTEFLGPLASNPLLDAYLCSVIDYSVYMILYMKFIWPADMMKANDELGEFLSHFSLNGIKPRDDNQA